MTTLPPANRKLQANKTRTRPLGYGELARTRELRKRGIHLQLIEAWRPFPTHLKTESEIVMTSVSELFPSRFLKAADLKGRTVKAKIKKVEFEEIGQDKDQKAVAYFEGVERGLVLNKTNAFAIAEMHGDPIEGWTGKEIELFSMMVPYQGQNVAAIRCRAIAEAATPPASADPNDPVGFGI